MTKKEQLNKLFKENGLIKEDFFAHQHYTIITRSGIEKIQAAKNIKITYDVIECKPNFAVVKAYATMNENTIETFASALRGATFKEGNTSNWYVMETAEKRCMSRAVLKLAGLYEHDVFGEEEADAFKKSNPINNKQKTQKDVKN